MAEEEGNGKPAEADTADDKSKADTVPKVKQAKKKAAKKKAAKKKAAKKKVVRKKAAPTKQTAPQRRAPLAESGDQPPAADLENAAVVESKSDTAALSADDAKPAIIGESAAGAGSSARPDPVVTTPAVSQDSPDEQPVAPAGAGSSGGDPAREQIPKQVEEKAIMSVDTSQSHAASSTGKGSMGFWPKAIVWIIIVIVGFMYIRSLAQREDVTATTDQAVATPEVQQNAVLEPVATEAAGTGETAQTDAILSGEKQLPAPEERAAMEQKTTEAAEQTTAEVQQLSAADTVVEETAPQPVAPTTVVTEETTQAAMAQTVDSVAEQPEAAAPETEAEVPEQAVAETSDTVAAEQSAEAMAQNEPAEATAATAVEESGTTEATASEPQQVTAEPAPITPPARPSFAERMQRERPQPPKRPTFEERFGRDAMARPQPSTRPSLEERFGQRPMTHPQPSEIPRPEAKDAEAAQTTDQPVEATTGPMQLPPRQAFADRMRRGWAPPPRRPSYPEFPGQGEAVPVPESDIYADPRQMGRPAFRPRNWGYGYGYPSAPYGGYQNYPRYYQGQEYPSARFPQ